MRMKLLGTNGSHSASVAVTDASDNVKDDLARQAPSFVESQNYLAEHCCACLTVCRVHFSSPGVVCTCLLWLIDWLTTGRLTNIQSVENNNNHCSFDFHPASFLTQPERTQISKGTIARTMQRSNTIYIVFITMSPTSVCRNGGNSKRSFGQGKWSKQSRVHGGKHQRLKLVSFCPSLVCPPDNHNLAHDYRFYSMHLNANLSIVVAISRSPWKDRTNPIYCLRIVAQFSNNLSVPFLNVECLAR